LLGFFFLMLDYVRGREDCGYQRKEKKRGEMEGGGGIALAYGGFLEDLFLEILFVWFGFGMGCDISSGMFGWEGYLFKEWRTCSSWAWSGVGGLLRLCFGRGRDMVSGVRYLGRKGRGMHVQHVQETYLIASSKTLLRFLCVRAEHSRYLTALISLATCTACSYCMGCILRWRSCSLTSGSSRKSSLVPTRMMGTPGA